MQMALIEIEQWNGKILSDIIFEYAHHSLTSLDTKSTPTLGKHALNSVLQGDMLLWP